MKPLQKQAIVLHTVTAPLLSAPAVSPETLRNFNDPRFGFFQNYHIRSRSGSWYGTLDNIGLQYPISSTLLLPAELTERLGLDNEDAVELMPSPIGELVHVYYRAIPDPSLNLNTLEEIANGSKLQCNSWYLYEGNPVEIVDCLPLYGFISEQTHLETWNTDQFIEPTPIQLASNINTVPTINLNTEVDEDN